jgi:chromate transporter
MTDAGAVSKPSDQTDCSAAHPSLQDLTIASFKVGCLGFGGPAGQIALMHRIFVDEKKWIGERQYLHALNYCMLLPGPEAQQLATYLGWLLHGVRGGVIAGLLFVLPGALIVFALSLLYAFAHQEPLVAAAFFGIKAAVLALVLEACVRIGKRALKSGPGYAIAIAAFLALFIGQAPFPLVVLAGAFAGVLFMRGDDAGAAEATPARRPNVGGAFASAALWVAAWLAPLGLSIMLLGPQHVLTKVGQVFSLLAVVTFGGAYATLAYLQQEAVQAQGWLSAGQMFDGLGLAETTPGPLVLVNQFVGFMAGWNAEGGGVWLAAAAALMASWCTFAPSFAWIFAGAPFAEHLRTNARATAALKGVTAAVLGVIVNLAIGFTIHYLFGETGRAAIGPYLTAPNPAWARLDFFAAALSLAACIVLFRFRTGILTLILLSAAAGVGLSFF